MTQIRNFAEAHSVLSKYVNRKKDYNGYKLERMQDLMQALGNPQDNYKVIHVAGTSGKTSTCYYIADLLQQAGQKVGLTVSPHVDEVNERAQINLAPMAETEFCQQLGKFIDIVNKLKIEPTYFELLVAFAFWQFDKQKVDYAVVEVGLGGLLDGTNVVHRPDKVCVITDIGLDHTNVLGNSISEIAAQKAGIIQDHNTVFMFKQSKDVMDQVEVRCRQKHATLCKVKADVQFKDFKERDYYLAKNVYDFTAKNEGWGPLESDKIKQARELNIPARMEVVKARGKTVIVDGSHNGQKIEALAQAVRHHYPNQSTAAMIGFVDGETNRLPSALEQVKHLTSKVFITEFVDVQDTPKKSVDADQVAELARQFGFEKIEIVKDPKQALERLLEQTEDLLVVTGSFYLLNQIRPLLLEVRPRAKHD